MKIRNYISVLFALGALYSCSDADDAVGFGADSQQIEIGSEGGTRSIKIRSGASWVATTDNPWITISPANGRGSSDCQIIIDSALLETARHGVVRIQNQQTWEDQEISVDQKGFDYEISVEKPTIDIANFAAYGTRYFDVKVKSNVDFEVEIPASASGWLKNNEYQLNLNRGIRPRETTVRFTWNINSIPEERIADIVFKPKKTVTLARQDGLVVKQGAAEAIEPDSRAGDSVAILGIVRTLGSWFETDYTSKMSDWSGIEVWEEGMTGYTPAKEGRVKSAQFFLFNTREGLPYEVQYLTAAESLYFFGNTNTFALNLSTGEYITYLTNLKRLTIGGYGLIELDENFTNLKNLEYLDLGSNNFQRIPAALRPENFPKLHALILNNSQRWAISDLSNTVRENYGGLVEEDGFPEWILEWEKLDTLVLSVNYLTGELPTMEHYKKYTQADINAVDTLPSKLIGIPMVLPKMKMLAINDNRLYGEIPDWLLYHPALNLWGPYSLVFPQEGRTRDGRVAGFSNDPVNLNYYYDVYTTKIRDTEE